MMSERRVVTDAEAEDYRMWVRFRSDAEAMVISRFLDTREESREALEQIASYPQVGTNAEARYLAGLASAVLARLRGEA